MRKLHQHRTKESNLKEVFSIILFEHGVSRARIARKTNLSKTTVSSLVEELINEKFVIDLGIIDLNKQGRNPNMLAVNNKSVQVMCITLTETSIIGSLVAIDLSSKVSYKMEKKIEKNYYEGIVEVYEELLIKSRETKNIAVCIIIPGIIYGSKKIGSDIISASETADLIDRLRYTIVDKSISFFHDISCIAYGERTLSKRINEHYLYLHMADKINGVFFIDGDLVNKADGMQTQFGHVSVDRNGEPCSCGNFGCIENIITQAAIAKKYQDQSLTYKELGERADKGDKKSIAIVESLTDDLAFALGNAITVANVPKIVIGGDGVDLGDAFISRLSNKLEKNGYTDFTSRVKIEYSNHSKSYELGVAGAVHYYIEEYFSFLYTIEKKVIIG